MKRLDHAELHEQLHDALRREAASIPAAVEAGPFVERLAGQLAFHFARFEIFDPEGRLDEEERPPLLPGMVVCEEEPPAPAEAAIEAPQFGRWLLQQTGRTNWIGDLARAARNDPGFPRNGDYAAVHARFCALGASGDDFSALEDAELDWLAL